MSSDRTGLKPFKPPPLNGIAKERVYQLSPDRVFTKKWELVDLVADSDAASGIAVRYDYKVGETLNVSHYEGKPKGKGDHPS